MNRPPGEMLTWTEPDPDSARIDESGRRARGRRMVPPMTRLAGRRISGTLIENRRRDALVASLPSSAANLAHVPSWFNDTPSSPPEVSRPFSSFRSTMLRSAAGRGRGKTQAAAHWLREIGAGRAFVTVGISHLTTSRRLGATAVEIRSRVLSDRRGDSLGHGGRCVHKCW